jgi:hydrogenase nickel incorporation protein HypA/HybF
MHELSICQGLIKQVENLARAHRALRVNRVRLQLGPLCGVEAALLEQAFLIARAESLASAAVLEIDTLPIRVRCRSCAAETEATSNRLICGDCGDWHTELLQGDEMLLSSLELELEEDHV